MLKSDAIPLFVPAGTSIQLSRKKSNNFGRFQAVGELSTLEKKASYDLLEAVTTLSKGAQRLFIHIIKHRDDCNFCHVPRESEVGTAAYNDALVCGNKETCPDHQYQTRPHSVTWAST